GPGGGGQFAARRGQAGGRAPGIRGGRVHFNGRLVAAVLAADGVDAAIQAGGDGQRPTRGGHIGEVGPQAGAGVQNRERGEADAVADEAAHGVDLAVSAPDRGDVPAGQGHGRAGGPGVGGRVVDFGDVVDGGA